MINANNFEFLFFIRDEQYRQLWAEMESFLQSTSTTSKMHAKVLYYLRGDSENDEENSNGFTPIPTDSKY